MRVAYIPRVISCPCTGMSLSCLRINEQTEHEPWQASLLSTNLQSTRAWPSSLANQPGLHVSQKNIHPVRVNTIMQHSCSMLQCLPVMFEVFARMQHPAWKRPPNPSEVNKAISVMHMVIVLPSCWRDDHGCDMLLCSCQHAEQDRYSVVKGGYLHLHGMHIIFGGWKTYMD
jgi:hypothetical protein